MIGEPQQGCPSVWPPVSPAEVLIQISARRGWRRSDPLPAGNHAEQHQDHAGGYDPKTGGMDMEDLKASFRIRLPPHFEVPGYFGTVEKNAADISALAKPSLGLWWA